jgi:hypothetical protein
VSVAVVLLVGVVYLIPAIAKGATVRKLEIEAA